MPRHWVIVFKARNKYIITVLSLSFTVGIMVEPLARTVGLSASVVTGSINSHYTTSELWNKLSCEHFSNEWLVYSCQKCEDCHCKKCKDLHQRVSISESNETPPISKHLEELKATKWRSYSVRLPDDRKDCWITGIAILKDNILVITDFENRKVKMFSCGISSLCLRFRPWDIAVIREDQVAVSMSGRQIALIDISSESRITLNNIVKLGFDVYGITSCGGKLIVTSISSNITQSTPSVKLIDTLGKVYWSVPTTNKQVFKQPMYVGALNHDSSPTVIVTDSGNSTVTLLNAETGEIAKRIRLPWSKEPQCVTTDDQNNVYLSYIGTNELVVMTDDLSAAQVLLSRRGIIGRWFYEGTSKMELSGRPWAIAYDPQFQQLIVSYDNRNCLDFYKVTKEL